MSPYAEMARAMEIFDAYPTDRQGISAEHEEIYAGPDPAAVSEAHVIELAELGWQQVPSLSTFRLLT